MDWRGAPEDNLWAWFWNRIAEAAGAPPISDEAVKLITAENRRSNLWTAINADAVPVLEHLHGRYRLGVVSNSDGTVAATFRNLGLARWFTVIVDSDMVGVAKPEPAIFQHALAPLGSVPEHTVFVGDSYALDVIGARRAGIRPILLDPYGLHAHRDVQRIARLSELSTLL